jgi:hypothetical protein
VALVLLLPACSVFEDEQPDAQVIEARIAKCMGIDPANVSVTWNEDGSALTVGTNQFGFANAPAADDQADGAEDPAKQMACIDAVLNS